MSKFLPENLKIKYIPPATAFEPVDKRKYSLTFSDKTKELFLSIGNVYDFDAVNPNIRDEVLAEWITRNGEYLLLGKVYINSGEFDEKYSRIRYMIFKRELDLALTGIIFGDKSLFSYYPWLLDSPIYVQFESSYPEFNQIGYFGTPRKYLTAAFKQVVPQTQV
ncbi:staygreen family protein [Bacillus sp. T33-2]|uniref:staygreen family protein n=1 Tax=Bacillus sp. T33-2 TaxID=2054168 RepID=UPI000C76AB4D|nr:staygreen family protein [Bacillus sp. T33-2]PLR95273.1 hypothetical protein CVD19_14975 [Bacillus sp. T33-2]